MNIRPPISKGKMFGPFCVGPQLKPGAWCSNTGDEVLFLSVL